MKILVVDDEKLLVKGIKFNLENDGYEVDTAYDGRKQFAWSMRTNTILFAGSHAAEGRRSGGLPSHSGVFECPCYHADGKNRR